jgi:hypothetical protein
MFCRFASDTLMVAKRHRIEEELQNNADYSRELGEAGARIIERHG